MKTNNTDENKKTRQMFRFFAGIFAVAFVAAVLFSPKEGVKDIANLAAKTFGGFYIVLWGYVEIKHLLKRHKKN